ncbi:MAG: tetratricopeptide repeat protein [Eubacterium sp.]|nr:tetratricopeptide repeat protein [Eubacterium sp.]
MSKGSNEERTEKREKFHIDNPRRFMLITDLICLLVLIIAIFLGARYVINEIFIKDYNKDKYDVKMEKTLLKLNFPEGYLAYYNLGNAAYKEGDYDRAISYYKKALSENPIHNGERQCDVRVNLALAMLQKINWDEMSTEKDVERVIRQLKAARNVLTEEGCANPDDPNGHNEEAEKLKKDIDDMLDQLQNNQDQNNDDQNNDDQDQNQDNQDQNDNNNNSDREDELRDQLEDQMTENQQEHQEGSDQLQQYQDDNNGSGGGGSSYDGKTW